MGAQPRRMGAILSFRPDHRTEQDRPRQADEQNGIGHRSARK